MSEGHVKLPGSKRPRKQGAKRVGEVDPHSRIEVTLTLRGPELPEVNPREAALPRDELERRYGASQEDLQIVRTTLERYGLTVHDESALTRSMHVSGTAAQMEDAFHPGLAMYSSEEQGEYRGREGELQIPKELGGIVTGVFGFDQRRVARRVGLPGADPVAPAQEEEPVQEEPPREEPVQEEPGPQAHAGAAGLSPGELEQSYSFPPGNAAGHAVALIEFGGSYSEADLRAFCEQHGLAMPNVKIVEAGSKPLSRAEIQQLPKQQREAEEDACGEVMMDIEIVAGLCPGADILVFFSSFEQKGWIDLLNQLIEGRPTAVPVASVSWGGAENPGEGSEEMSKAALEEINQRLQAAAQIGITVCAASGDDGSGDQVEDGDFHVNFPASSPYVLSVGGTMIEGENEVVWHQPPGRRNGGGGATGGGVSVIFDRPAWQTVQVASLNKSNKDFDGRVLPDIAALAGPPGYDLVNEGKREPSGGTSAATPLWASLIVRMLAAGKPAHGQSFLPPLLYESAGGAEPRGATACRDITEGNNASEPKPGKGYVAKKGYDSVSGWGVPNGEKLLASLP
jgi:kumamolisin